jgi:hypothetical protein
LSAPTVAEAFRRRHDAKDGPLRPSPVAEIVTTAEFESVLADMSRRYAPTAMAAG